MKFVPKALLLTLVLVVFVSVAFCQDYPEETEEASTAQSSFQEGIVDGKNDAKGHYLYAIYGCIWGPGGIVNAAIHPPRPDPQKVILLEQTKGTDYASAYSSSFRKESRKKNLQIATVACGVNLVVVYISYQILRAYGEALSG